MELGCVNEFSFIHFSDINNPHVIFTLQNYKAKYPKPYVVKPASFILYTCNGGLFEPNETKKIWTGVSIKLPSNTMAIVKSFNSWPFSRDIKIMELLIDPGFNREIFIIAHNCSSLHTVMYYQHFQIAQLILKPSDFPEHIIRNPSDNSTRNPLSRIFNDNKLNTRN